MRPQGPSSSRARMHLWVMIVVALLSLAGTDACRHTRG